MTEPLARQSIAVIGAGNLGSQAIPHLARVPQLGTVAVVDPDTYEEKNLKGQNILRRDVGRRKALVQARRMKTINDSLQVVPIASRVEDAPLGLLRRDVLAGGLDSKLARMKMNRIAVRLGRPMVDAGIRRDGMLGRITICHPAKGTACLECGWTAAQYADLPRKTACLNEEPGVQATDAPAELGGVVASYQVIECRELLAANGDGPGSAYQILIDLVHHKLRVSALPLNPNCRCDHRPWEIQQLEVDPSGIRVGDMLDLGRNECAEGNISLGLYGKVFVFGLTCQDCGARRRASRLLHRLSDRQGRCPRCGPQNGRRMIAGGANVVDSITAEKHPELLGRSMGSLGFRPHDVVTLRGPTRTLHYELVPSKASTEEGGAHAS